MFYGWRIVGGSLLSQAFVIGFFTYAVSLLTRPVQESFGVSVEMVMYSLTLGTFISLFSTYTAILSNMTPYATELGHEEQAASGLIMVVAISGLLGKLLFGVAADMLNHKVALWTAQLLVTAGFVVLALEPSYPLVVLACVSIGLAAGGMLPVWGALIADIFGLQSYGRAFGLMGPIITLFVMLGFPLAGRLYDATGSFSLCLWIFSALMVVAATLLFPLRLSREP